MYGGRIWKITSKMNYGYNIIFEKKIFGQNIILLSIADIKWCTQVILKVIYWGINKTLEYRIFGLNVLAQRGV